jgi:hypothetical protein
VSTAASRPDELVYQPHPGGSNHQTRADQQEGPYPLTTDYLCDGQGEPGEQSIGLAA